MVLLYKNTPNKEMAVFSRRYLPRTLSKKDYQRQKQMLLQTRKNYARHRFRNRKTQKFLASYPHKKSQHIRNAQKIYGVENIRPTPELAKKTGCSVGALEKIVNKGEGAYYSSGSRPNQTAQSWGLARLASAITGANASIIDAHILEEGCLPNKLARKLLRQKQRKENLNRKKDVL